MDLNHYFLGIFIIAYVLVGMVRFILGLARDYVKKKCDSRLMSKLSLKK